MRVIKPSFLRLHGLSPLEWYRDFLVCLLFFTRLPLPKFMTTTIAEKPDFSRAAKSWPLLGIFLAFLSLIPGSLIVLYRGDFGYDMTLAFISVALLILISGALHEDGLGDVADGFWGGSTVSRKLEIMKDSRIGAFGVVALIMSIGLRVTILAQLIEFFGYWAAGAAFIAASAGSRASAVRVWAILSPARQDGLSANLGLPTQGTMVQSMVFACGIIFIFIIGTMGPLSAITAVLAMFVSSWAFGQVALHHIGGHTGDVLGGTQIISEIAILLAILIFSA
ncbi:MAG: adenosylcobinamide-GDP ribazoletransferase [Cohaesibacteraceae bacterium]|nr:adenosylcobinamide-GDP ribazoletransferase [Cohaesibacteraceae bacterium]MBL4875841.1 adenosylcobinamide-GDP ribazoletransferase [Cohaesibacteraceae bacterium]